MRGSIFETRCKLLGVPLRFVPPSYSSLVGALFSQKWPELGRDQAACVVLAARATEQGNLWLENLCKMAVEAERVTLRFNAKGLFGHNATIARSAAARPPRHQRIHPGRSGLSPHRWQLSCGKQISDVLSILRADYRDRLRQARRDAVFPGCTKPIPQSKVLALAIVDYGFLRVPPK